MMYENASFAVRGSIVALVTPMLENGQLDLPALRALIDWHIAEGSDALVVAGTTGESPALGIDEYQLLMQTSVEQAAGRTPVIASAGRNSTSEAVELARYAKEAGASASLQVVPYYNKPTQYGLFRHFEAIAQAVDLPLILYNVPGRTVADLSLETVVKLAQVPGIVGIKDATGQIARGMELIRCVPAHFSVYSGDDLSAVALMLMGGHGNISVTANVAPRAMHALCSAALAADAQRARALQLKLLPLHRALFIESNPIPVKWALARLGKIRNGIRLPLTPLDSRYQPAVLDALQAAELL